MFSSLAIPSHPTSNNTDIVMIQGKYNYLPLFITSQNQAVSLYAPETPGSYSGCCNGVCIYNVSDTATLFTDNTEILYVRRDIVRELA